MKLISYFSAYGFSNSYILGPDEGGDAIIVDPGILDVPLLDLIENNKYTVKWVLITHSHTSHISGLKTLMKVYSPLIFSSQYRLFDMPCMKVSTGTHLFFNEIEVFVTDLQGHSTDSVIYRIENMLFTGDTLEAGIIGSTANDYNTELLKMNIKEKLFSFPDNFIVFPGHGPPTTVRSEKQFNVILNSEKIG